MDENAYREAYRAANPLECPFGKAILTSHFHCEKSTRVLLAERVAVGCKDAAMRDGCAVLLDSMRHKALFALKITHIEMEIPHAKEMKVQCGGLLGLQSALYPELAGKGEVGNVLALVQEARRRFDDLEALPYGEIMKSVVTYEGRRRGPPKG